MTFPFVLLIVAAYLTGSVPTAYLIVKWQRGLDIRRFGSGNVGVTNAVATGFHWTSLVVAAFDFFVKGLAPIYVARWLDLSTEQQIAVGLTAVCGHNWTIFLGFNGGRGALTTFGVVFAFAPWLAVAAIGFAALWIPLKQFSLGALVVGTMIPVASWFLSDFFHVEQSLSLSLGLGALVLLVIVRRLTVPRSEFWDRMPRREIFVNRLLYDRDIKDRDLWLTRRFNERQASM